MENGSPLTITRSDQLERKMRLTGKIIKTSKAGAIVDVGVEQPALLHISQIVVPSDEPIKRVEDALKIDQKIDVWVRNVRVDRIEVTMREPLKLEWRDITKDMVLKGKVVEIEKFGAFVDIGAERPGLMHISEISRDYVRNTTDLVNVGDDVEVKVIDFNRRKKQIKLSMKALQPEPEKVIVEKEPEEDFHEDKPKSRKSKNNKEEVFKETDAEIVSAEPELTAMELAWMEAKEKASHKKQSEIKARKMKFVSDEQTDILSRTLKDRR